jgi:hypothetical protein
MALLHRFGMSALLCLVMAGHAWAQGAPPAGKDAAPPSQKGLKFYGSDIHDANEVDIGGPAAISLVAARNGACSGKVVVRGDQPIQGLKASATDLKQGDAAIPATQVSVRYAVPWDAGMRNRPPGNDILLEAPLAEFPAGRVPVWVTVRVPKSARPGVYTGELTVEVKGAGPFKAPIKLDVQDWTLPDSADYRTWIELIQSPDTLTAQYDVPLWSPKHWDMVARSFKLMGETGCRAVYLPLMAKTNQGNEQSMVRFIKKADSKYDYDFSVFDKYLDAAEKNMGHPKLVILYAWDICLKVPKGAWIDKMKAATDSYSKGELEKVKAREALAGKGPPVTVVDPASGKLDTVYMPRYETPEGKAVWAPLWTEVRSRLQKRGLDKVAMIGMISDELPAKEDVAALQEFSGGMPWASCSHRAEGLVTKSLGKGSLQQIADVGFAAVALGHEYTLDPTAPAGRTYGWRNPAFLSQFWRFAYFNSHSLSTIRHEAECNITGNERGLSHIGADFWFTIKDKGGKPVASVADRYPESYWHNLFIHSWLLAPGPDGPVGTARLEAFREGVQECEARIAIETALTDPALKAKLGDDLAKKFQDLLDARQKDLWRAKGAVDDDFVKFPRTGYQPYHYTLLPKWNEAAGNKWFMAAQWADGDARLFSAAGEVQRKTSGK